MATLGAIGRSIATDIPVAIELEVLDGPPGPQLDRLAAATDAAMVAVGACDQSPLPGALAGAPTLHLMQLQHPARSSSAPAHSGSPERAARGRQDLERGVLTPERKGTRWPARATPEPRSVSAGSRAPS